MQRNGARPGPRKWRSEGRGARVEIHVATWIGELRKFTLASVIAVCAVTACRPEIPNGKLVCASSSDCPDGFRCEIRRLVCVEGIASPRGVSPTGVSGRGGAGATAGGAGPSAPIIPDSSAGRDGMDRPSPPESGTRAGGTGGRPDRGSGGMEDLGGSGGAGSGAPPPPCTGADLTTSPDHCGTCDHSCLGGTCSSGRCQPVHLSGAGQSVEDLHVGSGAVYWTERDPGRLKRIGLNGGAVTTLASDTHIYELALDADNVYAAGDSTLWKVSRADGAASSLLENARAYTVGTDGSFVYFSGNVPLQRVSVGGGSASALAMASTGRALAHKDGFVYWSNYEAGTISRVDANGGTPDVLASGLSGPVAIAVDDRYVYWADEVDRNLMQLSLDGGTPAVFASDVNCTDIATDGAAVYWVDYVARGSVHTRTVERGPITVLAYDQPAPVSLDVDGTAVYWANRGVDDQPGEVLKVAK